MAEPDGSRDESEESQAEPKFRVIDRRRFSSDGSERDAERDDAAAVEPARPLKEELHTATSRQAVDSSSTPAPGVPVGEAYEERRAPGADPTFSTLVLSLSTQALVLLGEMPDPASGQPARDLGAARQIIDLLAMLEQKTSGNLDADERNLLQRILYDLRLRFVELSRR